MGNVTLALDDEVERKLRELAHSKFGLMKGSMSKTIAELIFGSSESEAELAKKELLQRIRKGRKGRSFYTKAYESRSEIYGKRA